MRNWIKKWDLSIVYRALLVILDVLFINVSSFIALWVRFNMQMNEIPIEYAQSVKDNMITNQIQNFL